MIPYFEFPNVPQGYRTFKCARPGCRQMATMMVEMITTLAHLPNKRRCFCTSDGWEAVKAETDNGRKAAYYTVIMDAAPTGLYLYRARCDAPGGRRGWQYIVGLRREDIRARECPNEWALTDRDGNYIIREEQ